MSRVKLLLLGSACIVGAILACLDALTRPQILPPAAGRTGLNNASRLLHVDAPSAGTELSPMDEYRSTLDAAGAYLESVNGYTATFIRQIRKDDQLRELEEIAIKIRHQPFSVYMYWEADGQQVLYVEGENDGRLLARRTRGFFRRTIKLGPTSRLAMMDSRYPIYELGMLSLVQKAQYVLATTPSLAGVDCEVESTVLDGKPVRQFTLTFESPDVESTYSKCILRFSESDPMPVWITNYGWTADGEPGDLLEHYYYRDLQIDPGLTDLDFNAENEAYGF